MQVGLRIGDPAPNLALVIEIRGAQTVEASNLPFQSGLLHQPHIARCYGFGQRELVDILAEVLD
jgi:hypothetical protein